MSSFTFFDKRLGDLDQLLLADAEIGDQRVGMFLEADLVEQLRVRLSASYQSMTPSFAVSLPRKMFSAIESSGTSASSWWMMMMPGFSLSAMIAEALLLPIDRDLALIAAMRIDTAQHLHQGRFAGAVLADQGVDFAWRTARLTLFSALTPGNVLVMLRISRMVCSSSLLIG